MNRVEKPFAYCCNGELEACDCVKPSHGTAFYHATCIITNCRNRAPAGEPFCAKHRDKEPIVTEAIHPAPAEFSDLELDRDPILRYFHYSHLPTQLQAASRPFCELAGLIVTTLPRNAERTVALRKLLEAKDAAVRANVS